MIALILHQKVPRHLEMGNNRVTVIQINHYMFAKAPRPKDNSAPHLLRKHGKRGKDSFFPIAPKTLDSFPDDLPLQLRYDRLHFWQFWHNKSVSSIYSIKPATLSSRPSLRVEGS